MLHDFVQARSANTFYISLSMGSIPEMHIFKVVKLYFESAWEGNPAGLCLGPDKIIINLISNS